MARRKPRFTSRSSSPRSNSTAHGTSRTSARTSPLPRCRRRRSRWNLLQILHGETDMAADDDVTTNHRVVTHDEWLAARRELLEKEKAFTRQCDEMSRLQ